MLIFLILIINFRNIQSILTNNDTFLLQFNHSDIKSQFYLPININVFESYTNIWLKSHQNWIKTKRINPISSNCHAIWYPTCINDYDIDYSDYQESTCPNIRCYLNSNCMTTPSDIFDYTPPIINSLLNSSFLCIPPNDTTTVNTNYYGLNQGISPNFYPLNAIKLHIKGFIRGSNNQGICLPLENAKIDVWQVDVTKLTKHMHQKDANLNNEFIGLQSNISISSLRLLSCRSVFQSGSNGSYDFITTIPPSFGPPRHIVFSISFKGYQTLNTLIYFDKDIRLIDLTSGYNLDSLYLAQGFQNDNNNPFNNKPSYITADPRVAKLNWIETNENDYHLNQLSESNGYFETNYNFYLSSKRIFDSKTINNNYPAIDIDGKWIDSQGGFIQIETKGNNFWAIEYPHPRSWAIVNGVITGNTIRGVDFYSAMNILDYKLFITDNILKNKPNTIWSSSSTQSIGLISLVDSFQTEKLLQLSSNEISINWQNNYHNYNTKWSKINELHANYNNGYRFLKILITRVLNYNNLNNNGILKINEIIFYEGIIEQTMFPTIDKLMKSPRTPSPQMITCSTFQDQSNHCYKVFDGDHTSKSTWITKPIGNKNNLLTEPQYLIIDFGLNRGILPTGLVIICDAENAIKPIYCPQTFNILGSNDNLNYDIIKSIDLYDYSNEYSNGFHNNLGMEFNFIWEYPTGRPQGVQCGSCNLSPYYTCKINSFDGSCQSKYCNQNGICGLPDPCPIGKYLFIDVTSYDTSSFQCRLCSAGKFGNQTGLINDSNCSGDCEVGYFCLAGSTSPTQYKCNHDNDNNVFCPIGSSQPIRAAAGRKIIKKNVNLIGEIHVRIIFFE